MISITVPAMVKMNCAMAEDQGTCFYNLFRISYDGQIYDTNIFSFSFSAETKPFFLHLAVTRMNLRALA